MLPATLDAQRVSDHAIYLGKALKYFYKARIDIEILILRVRLNGNEDINGNEHNINPRIG